MVFKMLPEGFDGPIQSSCLHAIRRHSALGVSSYAIPGCSLKRKTEPGRTPVPFDLRGFDWVNRRRRRAGRVQQPVSSWTAVRAAFPSRSPRNRSCARRRRAESAPTQRPASSTSRNYGLGVRSRVVELIFSLTPWLRCPLGNAAGSFAVTSSTYSHRFSQHR
jgi:hypothetical protein